MQPPPPVRPAGPPDSKRGSGMVIFFVLIFLATGAAGLYIAPLGEFGRYIIFGSLIFAGILGLHYVVWGWWLPKILEKERQDSDSESKS